MNDTTQDPTTVNLATALAEAEAAREAADEIQRQKGEALMTVERRITSKRAAREAIMTRRLEGEETDDDAAQVAMLDADIGRLATILASAQAELAGATEAARQAQAAESARCADLGKHQNALLAADLERRLREIETTFVAGISRLNALKQAASSSRGRLPASKIFSIGKPLHDFVAFGAPPAE